MHDRKRKGLAGAGNTAEVLCFDRNDFMKENFSVDEFLHKNRNAPSLEQLRDNLGLYLKGLRTSMIDLINEDYADFVSLSANLVGLDQTIETIKQPLDQFRSEIENIKLLIQENEQEIRAQLERKKQLHDLKRNLQSLKKVQEIITKLKELLNGKLSDTLYAVDLERATLELIQLKFNEKFCAEYLSSEQKSTIKHQENQVLQKLRLLFISALKSATSTTSEQLERCLRIYITLNSCHTAEQAFREEIVAPYMSECISEHSLQNSPQGLAGIYSRILNFISLHMTDLLRLTQYSDKLRGFNFVVNSFWADVEMRLETHMTSIFAPGNSEIFYAKYKCTRDFLSKIEELLADKQAANAFRQHKQTISFQARWNLPVYFQICFQEIAGEFEGTLEPVLRENNVNSSSGASAFQTSPFNSAHKSIQCCWAEGIYLPEVFPKFYKLNVQIILRLSRWIADVIRITTTDRSDNSADSDSRFEFPKNLNRTTLLIALHSDIQRFIALLEPMQKTAFENMPKEKQSDATVSEAIHKSFDALQCMLSAHLTSIQHSLVSNLIAESGAETVRQVSDLPRLYRKTNREVPTRCSAYVEQMLRPLKAFAEQRTTQLGTHVVGEVLAQVFAKITTDYYKSVSDVLTSVQKTEESLRRLRNLKSGGAALGVGGASGSSMSDDDKIRQQLRVDVSFWTAELTNLNFMPTQVEKLLLDLNHIVEASIKSKEQIIT